MASQISASSCVPQSFYIGYYEGDQHMQALAAQAACPNSHCPLYKCTTHFPLVTSELCACRGGRPHSRHVSQGAAAVGAAAAPQSLPQAELGSRGGRAQASRQARQRSGVHVHKLDGYVLAECQAQANSRVTAASRSMFADVGDTTVVHLQRRRLVHASMLASWTVSGRC